MNSVVMKISEKNINNYIGYLDKVRMTRDNGKREIKSVHTVALENFNSGLANKTY